MSRYQLRIELLSDLCVSDGGVYNSALDLDICQDKYGFPVIPAKRLKGCLRESAMELSDWGEEINIDELFGKKGGKENSGKVRVSDAVLSNYDECVGEVKNNSSNIYHKQNILDLYSYVRTQTSIDYETGVAKQNSLRNIRVAKKGLTFLADINVPDDAYDIVDKIAKNLCAMGNSRTRGLGEVKIALINAADKQDSTTVIATSFEDNATVLEYELLLEEPVICKSLNGAEEKSQDYIEGSKIIGVVANRYRNKFSNEIVSLFDKGNIIFSNAYISGDGQRYSEVPGYVYAIKNDKDNYINKLLDIDNRASVKNGKVRQLNGMKHCYVYIDENDRLSKKEVNIEQRYHHRRPDDKSVGRADKNSSADSAFYQISSISSGQVFKGFVIGTEEQIKVVYDLLKEDKYCRIGYGSSAEYGKVKLETLKAYKPKNSIVKTDKLIVTLNSPAIIYNDNAMASTSVEDFKNEVLASLGIVCDAEVTKRFVSYTQVGGYNVTWNMRKPVVASFDKGSAIVIDLKQVVELDLAEIYFVGERITEGYGECTICAFEQTGRAENDILRYHHEVEKETILDVSDKALAYKICDDLLYGFIQNKAIDLVAEEKLAKSGYKPTVSNMILMCGEVNTSYEAVCDTVRDRYEEKSKKKEEKLLVANKILKANTKFAETIIKKFNEEYGVCNYKYKGDLKLLCLEILLQKIKYAIRGNELIGGKADE